MALFKSALMAVKFAVNYSNEAYVGRSTVSKIAEPSKGSENGLIGVEGAAQAGMILSMVKASTEKMQEACLVARCAAHKLSCSCGAACCSKYKFNWAWYESINFLSIEIKRMLDEERKPGTRGMQDDPALRRALIAKYFGERIRIKELAEACEITDNTVATHSGKITKMLKKSEGEAWAAVEVRLRDAEII